jgi:uncharacterized membrane-anchored protein YhcB (DUF1043 family)
MEDTTMRVLWTLAAVAALAGCGVETVGTAATGAAIKKQEMEQGQATMKQTQQRLDDVNRQMQQRADQAGGDR